MREGLWFESRLTMGPWGKTVTLLAPSWCKTALHRFLHTSVSRPIGRRGNRMGDLSANLRQPYNLVHSVMLSSLLLRCPLLLLPLMVSWRLFFNRLLWRVMWPYNGHLMQIYKKRKTLPNGGSRPEGIESCLAFQIPSREWHRAKRNGDPLLLPYMPTRVSGSK